MRLRAYRDEQLAQGLCVGWLLRRREDGRGELHSGRRRARWDDVERLGDKLQPFWRLHGGREDGAIKWARGSRRDRRGIGASLGCMQTRE